MVVDALGSVVVVVVLFELCFPIVLFLVVLGVVVVVVVVDVDVDDALRAACAAAISEFIAVISLWYVPNEPEASAAWAAL